MSHHRHRHRKHRDVERRTKPGASPGSIVVDPQSAPPELTLISYDNQRFHEQRLGGVSELAPHMGQPGVLWLNVDGLGDAATIEAIGKLFGFHSLALEDVVNVHQRPKVDDYGNYLFIVSRMAHATEPICTEQLSIFLGHGYVVTFQDMPGDSLEPVRERLRRKVGRIREMPADYLAYALLDATIDGYYPVIEQVSDRLETIEEVVLESADERSVKPLRRLKQDLLQLRRAVWPHREALGLLIRERHASISDETRVYLRDVYDHVVQLIDLVEIYRELAMDLRDFYMSSVSNRINETMRVLTIVSTVFIPLTFIAGVYGMNFDPDFSPYNMPELRWRYGYPACLAAMAGIAIYMLAYFRAQGWIRLRWIWPERHPAQHEDS